MKILHICTQDHGGAGKAVLDINKVFIDNGIFSKILVKEKKTNDENVIEFKLNKPIFHKRIINIINNKFDKKLISDKKYHYYNTNEDSNYIKTNLILDAINFTPDIVFIHWISNFCNFRTIKDLQKKTSSRIVFYPSDMSLFTGGCHYAWNCKEYENECKSCPAILSGKSGTSKINLESKISSLQNFKPEVIPGTSQLLNQIKNSALFREAFIHPITLLTPPKSIFYKADKLISRKQLNLPENKIIALTGALDLSNERKGFNHLIKLIDNIKLDDELKDKLVFVTIGEKNSCTNDSNSISIPRINNDHILASYYQAADMFISPSIEDSGPMMINQAISCGLPVLAFDIGVAKDLVYTGKTGYLANRLDINSLKTGLNYLSNLSKQEWEDMSKNCIEISNSKMQASNLLTVLTGFVA